MDILLNGTNVGINLHPGYLQELVGWTLFGANPPMPNFMKQMTILQYAKVFGVTTFIETGTYEGATTKTMAGFGFQCKSIEISPDYYNAAVATFAGNQSVELFHGDSGALLGEMMDRAKPPYIFWLDGHHFTPGEAFGTEETPIARELNHLLTRDIRDSVILIDDIRLFGQSGYPPVTFLEDYSRRNFPGHVFENFGDIFRITPRVTLSQKIALAAAAAE